MRAALLIILLVVPAVRPVLAQAPGAGTGAGTGTGRSDCNVVAQSTEVDDEGRFVRPPPTPDQCLFAAALITKLLQADARKVRRTLTGRGIPYPLQVQIGTGLDSRETVTWITGDLVIVAYRARDFSGTATSVLVSDLEAGTACYYPRWPTGKAPRQLSLEEIQDVLNGGLAGDKPVPTCYLRDLATDP